MKVKIKEQTNKKSMSLYKLAQVLNLPQQTIYSWASGRTQPSFKNLERLCKVLDCTLNHLYEVEK